MRGSRKFFQRGFNFDVFFFFKFDEDRKDPNITIICNHRRLSGQWWPNIECWFGSFEVKQGIRSSIGKKPYFL